MTLAEKSDSNIKRFIFVKIFVKRVFLPLSAIYFMQVAHFSITEIGLLGSLYFAINFLSDVPTGMFADRVGKVASLRIGAAMNIVSALTYVLYPTKVGIIFGTIVEAIGYGFLSGPGESLMHDSLSVNNRESEYTKLMSRTQSVSLIINALLVALITMTYKLNPKLPFVLGALAYTALFTVTLFMYEIARTKIIRARDAVWTILGSPRMFIFAIFYGIFGALYAGSSDATNIAFKYFGLQPAFLGWVFATASLVGALFGVYFHKLRGLKISKYIILDAICLIMPSVGIYLGQLTLLIVGFVITMTMFRYRRSIYQQNMFLVFPDYPKTTLISMMNNFEGVHLIWIAAAVGFVVGSFGMENGFGIITVFSVFITLGFILSARKVFNSEGK